MLSQVSTNTGRQEFFDVPFKVCKKPIVIITKYYYCILYAKNTNTHKMNGIWGRFFRLISEEQFNNFPVLAEQIAKEYGLAGKDIIIINARGLVDHFQNNV